MPKVNSFDDNVDRYDAWFERNRPAYESELEAIRGLLPKYGRGLEIGVGTGLFAAPLGLRYGLDPSRNMSKAAVKRGIQVILGVGENLPFKKSCFDIVLMVTTICFLDDVLLTLNEAYRVLTIRGCIVISFIDRESPLGKVYEFQKTSNVFYKDAAFRSMDEVLSLLKQAGFRDFLFHQTILRNPSEMKERDLVKIGYGEGSFVVVRGEKPLQ
ncbi:MAG: class I SAM-dependent methyltransferase [Thermodesulfobacteriota bacterium]